MRLGLNNVAFAGYIEDKMLPAFYKLSRGFVFPSCDRSEAFGISLLEASYFSKPMISTELGTDTLQFKLASGPVGVMAATNEAVAEAQLPMMLYVYGAVFILCSCRQHCVSHLLL